MVVDERVAAALQRASWPVIDIFVAGCVERSAQALKAGLRKEVFGVGWGALEERKYQNAGDVWWLTMYRA